MPSQRTMSDLPLLFLRKVLRTSGELQGYEHLPRARLVSWLAPLTSPCALNSFGI